MFWRIVKIFLLYQFLNTLVVFGPLVMPFYTDVAKLSVVQIMTLQSVFQFTTMFMEIPTGVVGDIYGRKLSVFLGNLFYSLGAFLYSLVPLYPALLIAEALMGIGVAFGSGAQSALVYDTFKEYGKEGQYFDYLAMSGKIKNVGFLVSALLAALFALLSTQNIYTFNLFGTTFTIAMPGWPLIRYSFFAYGIFLTLANLLLLFFIKEPKFPVGDEFVPDYKTVLKKSIEIFRKNRAVSLLAGLSIALTTLSYYKFWIGQRFLKVLGITAVWFGIMRFVDSLLGIVINHYLPRLRKRFRAKYIFRALAAIELGLFVWFLVSSIYVIQGLMGGLGFRQVLLVLTPFVGILAISKVTRPILQELIQMYTPSAVRATFLSFLGLGGNLIKGGLNPVLGYLADLNIRLVVYTVILLSISTSLAVGFWDRLVGLVKSAGSVRA